MAEKLRADLHAGHESSDSETETRPGLVASSATSVESVVCQEALSQHSVASASGGLSQHSANTNDQLSQFAFSDSEQARALPDQPTPTPDREISQHALSSEFTETESQKFSLSSAQADENVVVVREGKSTDPEEGKLDQAACLSYPTNSTSSSRIDIPRLELGCSDDEGAADLGLPYSDSELTNRTTDRRSARAMDFNTQEVLTPVSQIDSVASDLSARALSKAMSEVEEEEKVQEAIEQVSNEFVSGEINYLRHSLVESGSEHSDDGEEKRPSVYHICEPWSDQDVPDAWSTSSSKEVTPREVKKAVDNFKAVLMDEAPLTPGMQRYLTVSGMPPNGANDSIQFTQTPGPRKPLDSSTPFHKETGEAKSRDTVRETAEVDPDLDRTLVEDELSTRSHSREFRTPPQSSPERFSPQDRRSERFSPSQDRRSDRFSPSQDRRSDRFIPEDSPSHLLERRSPVGGARSPSRYLSEDIPPQEPRPSKREVTTPPVKVLKTPTNYGRSDTDDEFRELPSGVATSEDEQAVSMVSQSTYKDLPSRQTPEPKDRSAQSMEDSLGDTICREIEDFLELHAQAKALRSDQEGEYSEDSVAQKVQDLLRRCEMERMSERSTVVGSVVSDDLSDEQSDDNEDKLADRVRSLMSKVVQSDQEELDEQDPDDSLAKRIRGLLERTSHHQFDDSPRASPRSIHELIHSISINRSADHDVHRELDDIQENWERRKKSQSPASQAESTVSTAQSKNSDDYSKKRLAWDYGADLGERNLPQFVASVKASDDESKHWSRQRARSVSPSHDINDDYKVDLPTKSTSLLRVDRSDVSINTLREDRLGLAERVFSLIQKESPQEQAYNILREAEEQERRLATRSRSPRVTDLDRPSSRSPARLSSASRSPVYLRSEESRSPYSERSPLAIEKENRSPRYDTTAGHMQYYGRHKSSESLDTVKSNVESHLSLRTASTKGSTIHDRYADLQRPVSSPSLNSLTNQSPGDLRESDLDSRASSKRKRGETTETRSPSKNQSQTSQLSSFSFSPVSNKPYLASNTAQNFLTGQLQRATERKFESTPKSPRSERIPDHLFRGKPRPSLMQRFLSDQNETNHDASREISHIQRPNGHDGQDETRNDLVTLRQVMQHRDFSSSVETSQGETTMESTHTGSDDAQAPSFPSYAYGTRVNDTAPHHIGVYGNRSGGEFLIFPQSGNTTARSDLSQSSNHSRKRAWVEEQIEDTQRSDQFTTGSLKENDYQEGLEERREPRRSLQILQEILEKESDSEAFELDNVWERYQQRKNKMQTTGSLNVLRLLKSLVVEKDNQENLEASVLGTKSTLSAFSSIKTDGSWKVESNAWKFVEANPNFKMPNFKVPSFGQALTQSAPAALNIEEQSPRSDKTVTSTTTDDELRQRMATLLEETDSLTSIPEGKEVDNKEEVSPLPKDPHLAKIHMKIRLQREKYLKERRRGEKRKEKIDKLERILDAKTRGKDFCESSSASTTQSSMATTNTNISDLSSVIDSTRDKVECTHESHDSDDSYCPCKFGQKIESPKSQPTVKAKAKAKAKPQPVRMEFAKPTVQEQRPWVQKTNAKTKTRAIQTKKEQKHDEKLDLSTELRIKLVSEGTQTSPSLLKQEKKKKKKERRPQPESNNRREEKEILRSRENRVEQPPSRITAQESVFKERKNRKQPPRGNMGGMCWFIPLNQRPTDVSPQRMDRIPPYLKENLNPEDIVPGAEFCLDKNADQADKISLQDAFTMFKRRFISRSRQRQKRVHLLGDQKRMDTARQKQREALFSLKKRMEPNPQAHPLSDVWHKPQPRHFTKNEMKQMTRKVYRRLPEVVEKAETKKREDEYRNNRMRAEIYKRKQLARVLIKY